MMVRPKLPRGRPSCFENVIPELTAVQRQRIAAPKIDGEVGDDKEFDLIVIAVTARLLVRTQIASRVNQLERRHPC
jgi:hypothetical protein